MRFAWTATCGRARGGAGESGIALGAAIPVDHARPPQT